MLTKKQHTLLMYIQNYFLETGVCPSYEEMKVALNLKSKSGIHRLISNLEDRGYVRRLPNRARALEVLKSPDNKQQEQPAGKIEGQYSNNVVSLKNVTRNTDTVNLPLYGKIAAGTPLEAISNPGENIPIPGSMIGNGEHYLLEVDGDSMIEAGIHDGDTILIEQCDSASIGEIVVALIDNDEVTLKKLMSKGERIALEPANKSFQTQIYSPDRVVIQGRLVGLLRSY